MKTHSIKLLVTGGSGFIGIHIMEWAINKSLEVINFDINQTKIINQQKFWKKVDLKNISLLKSEIDKFQPTHILHLAALIKMDASNISEFDDNILGLKNILKVINYTNSVRHFVFISSAMVCKSGYIAKNETDYCPPNLYGESKVIGENIIRNTKLNCHWSIVRPTSIWGPWFKCSKNTFFKLIDKNLYFHIKQEKSCKPVSYVGNTVYMIMKILFVENLQENSKKTYYITDYPCYYAEEWANVIQKTLNSKPIKTLPYWFLKTIAIIGDICKNFIGKEPPLTSLRLYNIITGNKYPIDNVMNICGKLPFTLKKSVFLTAKWMFEKKLIKHKPTEILNNKR